MNNHQYGQIIYYVKEGIEDDLSMSYTTHMVHVYHTIVIAWEGKL